MQLVKSENNVKTSCYANKTCLSIPKEDQIKNIHTTDKGNLKDFNNFKNLMINEFESMKYSFLKEVNSFKKQLLETSEIEYNQIQSHTLKNELDRKDKVINTLLEKLEKKHHEETSPSQATTNGSSVVEPSSVIQATSVKTA